MNGTIARIASGLWVCGAALFASAPSAFAEPPARQQAPDKPPAAAQPSPEPKRTVYGDIVITGYQLLRGNLNDFAIVQFLGPNTTVDVPDKKSGSRLILH